MSHNITFTNEEMQRLKSLLDLRTGQAPTAQQILQTLRLGSDAGLELSLSSGRKNPLVLDARRRALATAGAAAKKP